MGTGTLGYSSSSFFLSHFRINPQRAAATHYARHSYRAADRRYEIKNQPQLHSVAH